jgi:hypothetical protein
LWKTWSRKSRRLKNLPKHWTWPSQRSNSPPNRGIAAAGKRAAERRTRFVEADRQAELLIELSEQYNTPDALCLMANGDVIVTVPNVNDRSSPPALLRIKPDNTYEEFYQPPPHPVTGEAYPFGMATDPAGDLYLADLQWFANPEDPGHHARVCGFRCKTASRARRRRSSKVLSRSTRS